MTHSISAPERLGILCPEGEMATGGSQEWYADQWAKKSGCGPTAASNIVWYMARRDARAEALWPVESGDKAGFLALMEEMFTHMRPGRGGVNTPAIFTQGVQSFLEARSAALAAHTLGVPALPRKNPGLEAVRDFILAALAADAPVAFLNLSNGTLQNLDSWHWVTLIALEPETMRARACDQGRVLELDLAEWLKSSLLGGAFVYLTPV